MIDKFFSELALEWKEREQRIPFAKFNCQKHIEFCESRAIPVFPFIKFYIRRHPIVFLEKRNKFLLNQFVEEILQTEPKSITTSEIKKYHEENISFLVFFGKNRGKLFHLYDLNSKIHREQHFFYIDKFDVNELKEMEVFDDHIFELC